MNAIQLITIIQGGGGKWTVHALGADGATLERREVNDEANVATCVDMFMRSGSGGTYRGNNKDEG